MFRPVRYTFDKSYNLRLYHNSGQVVDPLIHHLRCQQAKYLKLPSTRIEFSTGASSTPRSSGKFCMRAWCVLVVLDYLQKFE